MALLASPADELLRAALRGAAPAWPGDAPHPQTVQAVLDRADFHGVAALLHRCLPAHWPAELREGLRRHAVAQTLWEMRHQPLLADVLQALDAAGLQPLLLKGTALAGWLYEPGLRTRADTDLLVPPDAREPAHAALLQLGWTPVPGVHGEFVSYQAGYTRRAADGSVHALDLHWRLSNSELLASLFSHADLRREAQPLPALGPHARGTSAVHSLLIASLHRAVHRSAPYHIHGVAHREPDRLIWLMDIHRLAQALTSDEWKRLLFIVDAKGLRTVVQDALRASGAQLGTMLPTVGEQALAEAVATEPVAVYLRASAWTQQWMDLRALPGWTCRMRLLRELLLPAPDYMRGKFGYSAAPLPWLYLRRAAGGVFKRLRAKAATHP